MIGIEALKGEVGKWAYEVDRTAFNSAQQRLKQISPWLPENWRFGDEHVYDIEFMSAHKFQRKHLVDLLSSGYDSEEAAAFAEQRTMTQLVSQLESTGTIVAQPIPDMSGVGSKLHRIEFYMTLLANMFARMGLPVNPDLNFEQVCEHIGLSDIETRELLVRSLLRDPYVLADFVEGSGIESQTFFEYFSARAQIEGVNRVTYLRNLLKDGYVSVLNELNISVEDYQKHVEAILSGRLTISSRGRILEPKFTTANNVTRSIGEIAQPRDYAARELFADLFSMYVSFADFARIQGPQFNSYKPEKQLTLFKESEAFRCTLISADFLINPYLIDLAISCGGLEPAFFLLCNACTLNPPSETVTPKVKAALRMCIEAYQAVQISSFLSLRAMTDPEFFESLELGGLDSIMASARRNKVDPVLNFPQQLISGSIATDTTNGIWDIAAGSIFKNEHLLWTPDEDETESLHSVDVLAVLRDKLHALDGQEDSEQTLLQTALGVITYVNKLAVKK